MSRDNKEQSDWLAHILNFWAGKKSKQIEPSLSPSHHEKHGDFFTG